MRARYSLRLAKLEVQYPDREKAILGWFHTLSEDDLITICTFLFALRFHLQPKLSPEVSQPEHLKHFHEVIQERHESPAMAITRHYGLDYRRTMALIDEWKQIG